MRRPAKLLAYDPPYTTAVDTTRVKRTVGTVATNPTFSRLGEFTFLVKLLPRGWRIIGFFGNPMIRLHVAAWFCLLLLLHHLWVDHLSKK